MDEKEYESYRSDEKSQGKIPKSLYQFNNEKHQIRRESNAETATDEFDEEGNLIGRKVTRKASNAPTAKPKAVAVRTYDPKTKTFK